jgi:hypothetical protein
VPLRRQRLSIRIIREKSCCVAFLLIIFVFCCGSVSAQIDLGATRPPVAEAPPLAVKTQTTPDYKPITLEGRVKWWLRATVGPTSMVDGVIVAGLETGLKHPPEWGSGWDGFGKRYALRTSGIALSNAIEGSVGAAWGEDPRYFRVGQQGAFGSRIGHIVASTFTDRFRDGGYRPAVARFIAIPSSNVISNTWRPAGDNSGGNIGIRIGLGFAGKMGSNAFKEFWPDIRELVFHKR